GRQRIVYQAPGEPDAWRAVIAARLLADGWVDLEGDNPFVSHRRFRRVTLYPLVDVVEYVELRGGPNEAAIGYGWQLVPALWRLDYRSDIARDKYSDWKRFVPTGHLAT